MSDHRQLRAIFRGVNTATMSGGSSAAQEAAAINMGQVNYGAELDAGDYKDKDGDFSDEKKKRNGSTDGVTLKRNMGLFSGIALTVGTMIGSGIFVTPGGVIARSGSVAASLLIWLACGIIASLGAIVYAELGLLIPESGGEYAYVLATLGGYPAFLLAWLNCFVIKPASFAIISSSFASYFCQPFYGDEGNNFIVEKAVCVVAMAILCAINCYSVKWANKLQDILCIGKLVALAFILIAGFYNIFEGKTEHILQGFQHVPNTEGTFGSVALAFYSGLWSYDGWNQLNYVTEELKEPARNLPRSILLGIPMVTVLYVLTNISYLTLLSPTEVVESSTVAIDWASSLFPGWAAVYVPYIVALCVGMSTFGAANGTVFCAGRLCYAAARESHMPKFLALVHRTLLTPAPALVFTTIVGMIMTIVSDIESLIDFFNFTAWIVYGISFALVIILRRKEPTTDRPFKVWLPIVYLMTAISVYLVLAPIISDPRMEYVYVIIFILSGTILYYPFVYKKWSLAVMAVIDRGLARIFNLAPGLKCI